MLLKDIGTKFFLVSSSKRKVSGGKVCGLTSRYPLFVLVGQFSVVAQMRRIDQRERENKHKVSRQGQNGVPS